MVDAAKSYDQHASQWTERLLSGNNHAHTLLEKPAMHAMLPDLSGKTVLAMGCGSGEELALLLDRGAAAADIVGIDVSSELIQTAQRAYPDATFQVLPMEALQAFPEGSFDFIYSSLTMHYASEWLPILQQVRRILKPNGKFLFSTHHPIKWGAHVERGDQVDHFMMGYDRPKDGMPTVHGDYLGMRRIDDIWFGNMHVSYYHRPLSAIMSDIIASGLTIRAFEEPAPIAAAAEKNAGFHAIHSKIPLFMIFELENRCE
jgi:SAM-dependent methyltransferase